MNKAASNKSNAAKSTGPKSVYGKWRSAQNSRTHGLSSIDRGVDPPNIELYLRTEDSPFRFQRHGAQYAAIRNIMLQKIGEMTANVEIDAFLIQSVACLARYRDKSFRRWLGTLKSTNRSQTE